MALKHFLFNYPLPKGWRILTVDEIKAKEKYSCVAGPFGSSISAKFFVDEGIPVIRGNNLTDDLVPFIADGFAFVSEDKARTFKAQHVKSGDLVFTCWGTIGQVGLIPNNGPYPEYIISNKQLKLRPNTDMCDPLYLFYYFATPQMVQHIRNIASGTAVPGINLGLLKTRKVVLPPLKTQQKIAAILSAYDDLIENNTKRIALLEKAAAEIYREWFVRLRFPGHEGTRFERGMPVGWEMKPFDEVVLINPNERIEKSDFKPYVGMGDLSTSSMMFTHQELRVGHSGSKFRNGDTLFPRITPSLENGKRGYVMNLDDNQVGFGSTEFIVIRKKILSSEFIYLLTCTSEFRKHAELSMVGASGRQRVQEICFSFFLVKTPPQVLMNKFSSVITPLFSEIKTLYLTNSKLKKSRDLLLPRLISGKLSVEDLDIRFPASLLAAEAAV